MRKIKNALLVCLMIALFASKASAQSQNVSINTTGNVPDNSAILDVSSTDKGLLIPRMTTAQRTAILLPATGLLVYDTNFDQFWYFDGTIWVTIGGSGTPGPTGPTGGAGATGIAGVNGIDGATGPAGPTGAGIQGPTGPTGIDGPTGPAGSGTGPTGPTGADGATGSNGVTGPIGPAGADGATGPAGATGAAGTNGTNGTNATNGTNGATGPTGTAGTNGTNGTNGATGPTGPSWTLSSLTYNAGGTITINGTAGSGGPITTLGSSWLTVGNTGTIAGTNFVGTTDAQSLIFKTAGSAATNERMRMLTTPQIIVNSTTAQAGDLFSVYGSTYAGAINTVAGQTDYPFNSYSTGAFAGVYAENTGTGQGILGNNTLSGVGVYGQSASGVGVFGTSTSGYAVIGNANGGLVSGVRGFNANATGTGVIGVGNNIVGGTILASGSGVGGNGLGCGVFGFATTAATGSGVMGFGNNLASWLTPGTGAGVSGNGENFGVVGYGGTSASANVNDKWGGYFEFASAANVNGFAYVGGRTTNIDYGILSNGTKSTMVKDDNGNNRVLFCTEAPEVLFQDFGTGQLINGIAHIYMDPLFAKSISAEKQIRVFIQLEGDCKGVFVKNKSNNGFDVVELQNGNSNVSFTWQVIGNRANTYDASGNLTNDYSNARFPVGPERMKSTNVEKKTSESNDKIQKSGKLNKR
jgi:hypothetical protein